MKLWITGDGLDSPAPSLCMPSKHKTLGQYWYNVGPSSLTLAQHCTNIAERLVCLLGMQILHCRAKLKCTNCVLFSEQLLPFRFAKQSIELTRLLAADVISTSVVYLPPMVDRLFPVLHYPIVQVENPWVLFAHVRSINDIQTMGCQIKILSRSCCVW